MFAIAPKLIRKGRFSPVIVDRWSHFHYLTSLHRHNQLLPVSFFFGSLAENTVCVWQKGKGEFFVRIRNARKIISTEIICTNKNYVELEEKRSERTEDDMEIICIRNVFCVSAVDKVPSVRELTCETLQWNVSSASMLFARCLFIWILEWALNTQFRAYEGIWCSRSHWVKRLSSHSQRLSQFRHFNVMCFLYKCSSHFRKRVYTCKVIDFVNR